MERAFATLTALQQCRVMVGGRDSREGMYWPGAQRLALGGEPRAMDRPVQG